MSGLPMFSRDLPSAIRLQPQAQVEALQNDLRRLSQRLWRPEEPFRFEGFFASETKIYHNGDWSGISLRSQGGRTDRTDPGGPGLEDFADTELMQSTPYIARMLGEWGVPLRSVRLLRLPPDGSIMEHRDTYHGFEYGQIRVHVPILTNPDAITYIRREKWHWRAGEVWYGDFGSLHSVHNGGMSERIHLVADVLLTEATLARFPEHLHSLMARVDVLFHEEPCELPIARLRQLECRFRVPSTLVRGIFDIDDGIVGQLESALRLGDSGELLWTVEGKDVVRLRPLAGNRLAFTGWTLERYFEYSQADGRVAQLALVLRRGREQTKINFHVMSDEEAHSSGP